LCGLGLRNPALHTIELSGGLRALRLGLRKAGGTLADTGFRVGYSLEDGVRAYADWLRANPDMLQ